MRNTILSILMACALGANAQDATSYIQNPSFEKGNTDGWSGSGMNVQGNDVFKKKSGAYYAEIWTGRGGKVANASLRQTITNLPMGTYRLTASAQNIQEDTPQQEQTGVYLYADDSKAAVNVENDYSVEFTTVNGEVEIGFVVDGATGNYVCVDNFRLELLNNTDVEALHAKLQLLIDAAEETNRHVTGFSAQTELDELTAAAKAEMSKTTTDGLYDIAVRLTAAIRNYPYGIASEENPCLMSDYVMNPNFAQGLSGWVNVGLWTQTGNAFTPCVDNSFVEKWTWHGGSLENCSISQTVKNLPNGRYILKAVAQSIQQGDNDAARGGSYIFADANTVEVGVAQDYTINFTIVEKQTTIGFKTISTTANWVSCDNFRLYFMGYDTEAEKAEITNRINYAKSLTKKEMDADALAKLQAAINAAETYTADNIATLAISLREACEAAEVSIENTEFYNRVQNPTGTAPQVITGNSQIGTYMARGSTVILGRLTVTGSTSDLKEVGYCYSSTNPNPTVLDERSTAYWDHNGQIFRMEGLQPATLYYVRAYVLTNGYATSYGEVKRVYTLPMGNCTYSYNWGGSPEENDRINSALADGTWNFNNYASVHGYHTSCSYGSGTPTADCSYGGSMRVGPNASYQRTGTIQHEMLHGIGIGTIGRWWDTTLHNGEWKGERANLVAQFFDNNPATRMAGDGMHMWPYGINGAHEDTGSQALYCGNAMIAQGMGEDGLTLTGQTGNAQPAWVFEHEENTKYYLTNEKFGIATGYLGEESSKLVTKVMTVEELTANDAYAWYITFTPDNQFYQFRNVATGHYLSYNSGFKAVAHSTPTSADNVQLMNSRGKVEMKNGTHTFSNHSYWIFNPQKNQNPPTLTEAADGSVSTVNFDLTDGASQQRWFILDADGVEHLSNVANAVLNDELLDMIAFAENIYDTPHDCVSDTTDQTLINSIELAKTQAATLTKYAELQEATNVLRTEVLNFLGNTAVKDKEQPYVLNPLLKNMDISNAEDWSVAFTYNHGVGEFFNATFTMNQTSEIKLPKGSYRMTVQAFQRPGAYNAESTVTAKITAYLTARGKSTPLPHILDGASENMLTSSDKTMQGLYIPDNMESAAAYFETGKYEVGIDFKQTAAAKITFGLRCGSKLNDAYWVCFDNFNLYGYGNETAVGIETIHAEEDDVLSANTEYYSLQGIKLNRRPTQGLYIQKRGGKTVVVNATR